MQPKNLNPAAELNGLFDLREKVVIVTGSTRGIGYTIAAAMLAHGATVVVSSESERDTREASERLGCTGIVCDVADDSALASLVEQTVSLFGGFDILVSNAGINGANDSMELFDNDLYDRVIAINLRSMVVLTQLALPHLVNRENSSIILTSSIAGLRGNHSAHGYAIAKAGVAQLARNLAVQWGPRGVRTNAIAPGLIETTFMDTLLKDEAFMARRNQMTPLRRTGSPHEVAGAAVFLASKAGGFVNGHTLVVDGGTLITDGN